MYYNKLCAWNLEEVLFSGAALEVDDYDFESNCTSAKKPCSMVGGAVLFVGFCRVLLAARAR
jgi:hypothetical protein